MGNYLSSPNVVKHREDGLLGQVKYGLCAMQGWRVTMEDSHIAHLFEYLPPPSNGPSVLFGVYDGHGGPHVARFVARHLVDEFIRALDLNQGHLDTAFRTTYIALDILLRRESNQAELEWFSKYGSTAATRVPCHHGASPYPPIPRVTPAQFMLRRRNNAPALRSRISLRHRARPEVSTPRRHQHLDKVFVQSENIHQSANLRCKNDEEVPDEEMEGHTLVCDRMHKLDKSLPESREELQENQANQFTTHIEMSEANSGTSLKSGVIHNLKGVISTLIRFGSNALRGHTIQSQGLAMLSGCTAITVLITPKQIIVANAGDSRAVLCRDKQALDLSRDHKPTLPDEKARIYTAGGWLEMGRVNGNLNLSRAVGDLFYKSSTQLAPDRQIVSVVPDIVFVDIQEEDEFLIIGCDGIWEASSSQDIVDFILDRLDKATKLSDILVTLFEELISPNPSLFEFGCDNMTAILVDLKPGKRKHVQHTSDTEETQVQDA